MSEERMGIVLRSFMSDDAEGVAECIREEYGRSYFRPDYYRPAYLAQTHESGRSHFLVAAAGDAVAGVLELVLHGRYATISTGIVRKAHRGRGIMRALFRTAVERAQGMAGVDALCCRSVAYHDITQRRLEALGFVPTALLMAEFLTEESCHSYQKDANAKHPHVLLVRSLREEASARDVHVPSAYRQVAEELYRALRRRVRIAHDRTPLCGASRIRTEQDRGQRCCSIFVTYAGADLTARIEEIQQRYSEPLQTFNVFLHLGGSDAIAAIEELRAMGYFFTGFFPICYEEEYMALHNPMGVAIHRASFVLTPAAARVMEMPHFALS